MHTPIIVRSFIVVAALLASFATTHAEAAPKRTVSEATPGEPMEVLFKALRAAEAKDFDAYVAMLSPDMKWTPAAIESVRKYSWKRFSGRVNDYFVPGTDHHIVVTREEVNEEAGTARIFLDAPGKLKRDIPTPCRFKKIDGKWLVHENSL